MLRDFGGKILKAKFIFLPVLSTLRLTQFTSEPGRGPSWDLYISQPPASLHRAAQQWLIHQLPPTFPEGKLEAPPK